MSVKEKVVVLVRDRSNGFAGGLVPAVTVAMLGTVVAVVVLLVPATRFHLLSPSTPPVLIAGNGAAALFVAYLATRRFARAGADLDFGVAVALGLIGLANIVFVLQQNTAGAEVSTAELLPYHLTAAAVLTAAALLPLPALLRRTPVVSVAASGAILALTLLLLHDTGVLSTAGMNDPDAAESTAWRIGVVAALIVAAGVLAPAAGVRENALLRWLVVGTLLAAGAQAVRLAEPIADDSTVTWAHAFYAGAMLALLAGALAEVRSAQREASDLAVADERRRVARDIHDGPAQDMAFVATQSWHLARSSGDERLREIAFAAARALDDSRAVVGELTQPVDRPLQPSLARLARECRDRWGLHVTVALESSPELETWQEHELIAISREALSNAARHSDASRAEVRLGYLRGVLTLTVSDNGRGFDAEAARRAGTGYGIQTMIERGRLMGGDVRFESTAGRGTRIEVPIR